MKRIHRRSGGHGVPMGKNKTDNKLQSVGARLPAAMVRPSVFRVSSSVAAERAGAAHPSPERTGKKLKCPVSCAGLT